MSFPMEVRCVWCRPPHVTGSKPGGIRPGEKTDGICEKAVLMLAVDCVERKYWRGVSFKDAIADVRGMM